MSRIAVDNAELATAPRVTLGGRKWPIPLLAFRQNKHITPLVMSLNGISPSDYTDAEYDKIFNICYVALTRAHPDLTIEDFEDLPISVFETIAAFQVIIVQAGLSAGKNQLPATSLLPEATPTKKPRRT